MSVLGVEDSVAGFLESRGIYNQTCYVALSGGADSCALLLALSALASRFSLRVIALHINHRLHPHSDEWAEYCESFANSLSVDCYVESVDVDLSDKLGPEASARAARWQAFYRIVNKGYLFTAHHMNDQVETFLQRALRGGGLTSLGGIKAFDARDNVYVCRPLLSVTASDCRSFVRACGYKWIEDPSNSDIALSRNYIRHEVVPLLEAYWPRAVLAIAKSSQRLNADYVLLEEYVTQQRLSISDRRWGVVFISRSALHNLSRSQQAIILRMWYKARGMYVPDADRIEVFLDQSVHASRDKHPSLSTEQGYLVASGDGVWLLRCGAVFSNTLSRELTKSLQCPLWSLEVDGQLPDGLRVVSLCELRRLSVCSPKRLKKHFHALDIPYPLRRVVPYTICGSDLIAIADTWLNKRYCAYELTLSLNV